MAETYEGLIRRKTAEAAAYRIRAELVCCDIYGKVNDAKEMSFEDAMASKEWHDLCYWGEAAARLAEHANLAQDVPDVSVSYAAMEEKIAKATSSFGKWRRSASSPTGRHRRD